MDIQLRRVSSLDKASPSENRQETATVAARDLRESVSAVTAGRSDGVVQPSTGQLDPPLHVAAASPAFAGEPQADGLNSLLTPWLAVADYVNHRSQCVECNRAFGVWRVC